MHNAFSPSFYAGDAWGSFNSLMRMIIEMAQIKPGEKVLDVGCGAGNLTLSTKSKEWP